MIDRSVALLTTRLRDGKTSVSRGVFVSFLGGLSYISMGDFSAI